PRCRLGKCNPTQHLNRWVALHLPNLQTTRPRLGANSRLIRSTQPLSMAPNRIRHTIASHSSDEACLHYHILRMWFNGCAGGARHPTRWSTTTISPPAHTTTPAHSSHSDRVPIRPIVIRLPGRQI